MSSKKISLALMSSALHNTIKLVAAEQTLRFSVYHFGSVLYWYLLGQTAWRLGSFEFEKEDFNFASQRLINGRI